jgi:hypothetical protein
MRGRMEPNLIYVGHNLLNTVDIEDESQYVLQNSKRPIVAINVTHGLERTLMYLNVLYKFSRNQGICNREQDKYIFSQRIFMHVHAIEMNKFHEST